MADKGAAYQDLMRSLQKREDSGAAQRDRDAAEKKRREEEAKKKREEEERQRIERERAEKEGGVSGRFRRGIEAWRELRDAGRKEKK